MNRQGVRPLNQPNISLAPLSSAGFPKTRLSQATKVSAARIGFFGYRPATSFAFSIALPRAKSPGAISGKSSATHSSTSGLIT